MNTLLLLYRFIYRFWKNRLVAKRNKLFPRGALCYYKNYTVTPVKVVYDDECPIDKVPVLFENGNVWYKDFEELRLVPPVFYS